MNLDVLNEFPGVQITPEELETICASDGVLMKMVSTKGQMLVKNEENVKHAADCRARADGVTLQIKSLEAEVRSLNSAKGIALGEAGTWEYRIRMNNERIRQLDRKAEQRRRQLQHAEIRRRLNRIGKSIKLGIGHRKTTAVVDVTKANQYTSGIKDWPRVRDLPEDERAEFDYWIKTARTGDRPRIEGPVQDGYYPWDYNEWKKAQEDDVS